MEIDRYKAHRRKSSNKSRDEYLRGSTELWQSVRNYRRMPAITRKPKQDLRRWQNETI